MSADSREERQECWVVSVWVETAAFTVWLQTNMHGPTLGEWSTPLSSVSLSRRQRLIPQDQISWDSSCKREKVPFFKRVESWSISEKLFDCFIVLFMKAGGTLLYPHTKKLQLFQVSLSTVVRTRLFFFYKMHNESFMDFFFFFLVFGKQALVTLLNIVI